MEVFVTVIVVLYVLSAAPLYIIASRTNAERAWLAWVPILSIFLLAGLAADEGGPVLGAGFFLLVLLLIPIVNILVIGSRWADIAENNRQRRLWGWLVPVGYLALGLPALVPMWVIALRTPRAGPAAAA